MCPVATQATRKAYGNNNAVCQGDLTQLVFFNGSHVFILENLVFEHTFLPGAQVL